MNKDTDKELSAKAHQTSATETQQIPTTALCAGTNIKADSETHSETDTQKKTDILIQPRGIKREVADDFADPRASAPKEDLSIENSLDSRITDLDISGRIFQHPSDSSFICSG